MQLDRYPDFIDYLLGLNNVKIALHGLHHVHPGFLIPVEFQNQDALECELIIKKSLTIFKEAKLKNPIGMCPPGWNLPIGLKKAITSLGLLYVASARDLITPIKQDAVTNMSGEKNLSLIYPHWISDKNLLHIPTNFQATSKIKRAFEIIEAGGLLSIKSHIIKEAFGFISLDGMDKIYRNYLDALFTLIEDKYGDSIWWTTMEEISERMHKVRKKG